MNKIRESLHFIARNSSAFGLVQPHLERTRLCTLPDSELDPRYLRQREELRDIVLRLARPKVRFMGSRMRQNSGVGYYKQLNMGIACRQWVGSS